MSCRTCSSPKHLLTPSSTTSGWPSAVSDGSISADRHGRTRSHDPACRRPRVTEAVGGARATGFVTFGVIRDRPARAVPLIAAMPRTVRGPHLRVPDERPRLRAAVGAAGGGAGYVAAPAERAAPTSSCSTPARCGRTPTTGSTATSATCAGQGGQPGHADRRRRLPGAEGPRQIAQGAPGSTSCSAPTTSARCRCCWSGPGINEEAQVEILESLEVFPSTLPTRRESAYAAWVSISVGCNNTCTFCIVPSLRGKEKDRRPGDVLAEVAALVAEGVARGHPARPERQRLRRRVRRPAGVRQAAARLRRHRGPGAGPLHLPAPARLHRRRDRRDGRDAERHAQLHMPLQSGSDRCCRRCAAPTGRSATSASSSGSARPCPTPRSPPTSSWASPARPRRTSRDPRRRARGSVRDAFTFQYSMRPGTPAATMDDQIPKEVVQERYERLVALQRDRLGGEQEPGRPHASRSWSPRARAARTAPPTACPGGPRQPAGALRRSAGRARGAEPRPGDVVTVEITYAAPHHLVADGPCRRTPHPRGRRLGGAQGAAAGRGHARHAQSAVPPRSRNPPACR